MQKEIKTPRNESVFLQAMVNMYFTHNWCNDKMKQTLAPYDVTPQQFNMLRILRGQYPKPSTINLLKSKMLDKMCDASRIVDRLMHKDLLVKDINIYDKRAVDIIINEKGLSLLRKMDKEVDLSGLLSPGLTKEEAIQLNTLLDKVRG